ncbi:prohibitin 1, partial [Tanacetum coccineum]
VRLSNHIDENADGLQYHELQNLYKTRELPYGLGERNHPNDNQTEYMEGKLLVGRQRKYSLKGLPNFNLALDDVSIANPTFGRECTAAIEAKQMVAHELEKVG